MPQLFLNEMRAYRIPYMILEWGSTLVPIVAAVVLAYHFLRRLRAEDEQESARHMRAIRTTLVGVVLLVGAGALLKYTIGFTDLGTYGTTSNPADFGPCWGTGWRAGGVICP